jgi:ribosome maturation factor RimP
MNSQALTDIRRMAEEVATREGCYLYDLEFVGGHGGRALRVTIDKEGTGGVSVEDCTNVSRGLNLLLDVDDKIPGGQYQLEVSSPGLERVLKEPMHFERSIGREVNVKTFQPLLQFNESMPELGKAKGIQGKLLSADASSLKVAYQDREVSIPMESVTKAHVVFEFTDSSEKKSGTKPGKGPKKGKDRN